jgi:superfamily II DNA or RNA helicase
MASSPETVGADAFFSNEELKDSLVKRIARCCMRKDKNRKREELSKFLRKDKNGKLKIPGKLLDHQLEASCLMSLSHERRERGGLLCLPSGTGKTIVTVLHGLSCSDKKLNILVAPELLLEVCGNCKSRPGSTKITHCAS